MKGLDGEEWKEGRVWNGGDWCGKGDLRERKVCGDRGSDGRVKGSGRKEGRVCGW